MTRQSDDRSTVAVPDTRRLIPQPSKRSLRVFAFDPQASLDIDTAVINDALVDLSWEANWEDPLEKGPVNEYLEVVDFDPASRCFYAPVDPGAPLLLAQNGLAPSDGNPQFHQQMSFAVAMKTIRSFERALGRPVFWQREGDRREPPAGSTTPAGRHREYVRQLRIYPHAMREPNAYYSPKKAALLFGYFRGRPARDGTGGEWVFTCLSQDIVAHETTHAILHGMWPRSIESSNPDTLAFHEAFADIVALFQHFAMPKVVAQEMARSGGSMRSVGLLNGLAQQFGRATGREGPLRLALDLVIKEEELLAKGEALTTDRHRDITEPHKRGQILVAAIFDAFVTIFNRRTDDLFRITLRKRGDTDNMPPGLATRLADGARKSADEVLRMCIRGLDYLPPIDVTFGEYLRAIITADTDLVPEDPRHYRTAFAEAFRKRGISSPGQSFSSTDSLMWDPPEPFEPNPEAVDEPNWKATADASFSDVLPVLKLSVTFDPLTPLLNDDGSVAAAFTKLPKFKGAAAYVDPEIVDGVPVGRRNLRDLSMLIVEYNRLVLHRWLTKPDVNDAEWEKLLGICLRGSKAPPTIFRNEAGNPKVEVHSVRVSRRQGPDGQTLAQVIIQVTQRRRGYYSEDDQKRHDAAAADAVLPPPDFIFRGGATVLVDLNDGRVRTIVRKDILSDARLKRQRGYLLGDPDAMTFAGRSDPVDSEPFAFLHRGGR